MHGPSKNISRSCNLSLDTHDRSRSHAKGARLRARGRGSEGVREGGDQATSVPWIPKVSFICLPNITEYSTIRLQSFFHHSKLGLAWKSFRSSYLKLLYLDWI